MAALPESDLLLHIQPDSPVPIYEQIVAQVTFAIASGTLEPGTLIPSVRDLAGRLLVHPNTVARAFQELERRGVVTAKRGRGMEVTPDGPAASQTQRRDIVRRRIREALREAVSSALTAEEIRALVEEELARAKKGTQLFSSPQVDEKEAKRKRAASPFSDQHPDFASSEKHSHAPSN